MPRPPANLVHLVPPGEEPDYDRLEAAIYPEVERVLEAEELLKRRAIEALHRGDTAVALEILERWLVEPPVVVAAGLEGR